ncbi:MAG: phosphotransferase [Acidimicrobiales bacterium]
MGVLPVPHGMEDLRPQWLTAALADVAGGAAVIEVTCERVGNGMVADSVRLGLRWDGPTAAPVSVIAKVPAAAADSRSAAAATRTYELEAAFYQHLAGTVDVHRPVCFLSLFDPGSGDYVVLLEDLAPADPGDQLTGCGVDDAAAVLPELAALHAPRWGDPTLLDLGWLPRPGPEGARGTAELVALVFPGFVDRYQDQVDADVLRLAEGFVPRIETYLLDREEPWTVNHGDFRLDNLLFGGARVAVLDWQTVRAGPALSDVAYFVGSALAPEDRRAYEADLLRAYHGALAARGVQLGWDRCWAGYRYFGFDGLLMGIVASMLVARTDRGDQMFLAMVNRHGRQLLDLESAALLATR